MSRPWHLSRRTFLRGLGTAIALPFLEAMIPPGRAGAGVAAPPRRFLAYYVPNGMHMPAFTPAEVGEDYTLTQILEPLAPIRHKALVLSGLDMIPATDQGDGGGDHGRGTGAFLTATHVKKTEGADIQAGVSMDQIIAQSLTGVTPYRSLEVGIEGGSSAGDCDTGYSCAYTRNIAWSSPTTPIAKETSPQLLFDRLFGGGDANETEEQRARRILYEQSILDFVTEDTRRLNAQLGARDKAKLDEYLTGIRELEQRLNQSVEAPACDAGPRPETSYDTEARILQMSELMVLALQCDLTRVITFMQANAITNRTFPQLGISEGHHSLSHHRGNAEKQAKLAVIDAWEVAMVTALAQRMDAVVEADGSTLLDNSVVFFGSELADGQLHEHVGLPILLFGKGGGSLRPGRHVRYEPARPVADLFVTLLAAMGVPQATFGDDGTRPLTELS